MKLISVINSPPPESLIDFIIENYHTQEEIKHIYTKKHFDWYLSKNNANYYEFVYIELHEVIIACIMLINVKNTPNNLLYINFSCTHKNYRKQGLSKYILNHLYNKAYDNENIYFYTIKPFTFLKTYKIFNFLHSYKENMLKNTFKPLNIKLIKNINNYQNSEFHKTISIYNTFFSDYKIVLYKVLLKEHSKIYTNYYIVESNTKITFNILCNIFNTLTDADIISFTDLNIDKNLLSNENIIFGNKNNLYYLSKSEFSDDLSFSINIF